MEEKKYQSEEQVKELNDEDLENVAGGEWRNVCTPEEYKHYRELYDREYELFWKSRKTKTPAELKEYEEAAEATRAFVQQMLEKYGQ